MNIVLPVGISFYTFQTLPYTIAELNDRTQLYADEYHMNLTGTETFTRVLADRLDDLTLAAGGWLCDT